MNTFDTVAMEFDLIHHTAKQISLDDLNFDSQEKNKIYWVHCNLNQMDAFIKVGDKLRLPTKVIELCSEENSLSNLIDTDNTLTLQIKCLASLNLSDKYEINLDDLVIHLTKNYCFTASNQPVPILFEFLNNCSKSVHYAKSPCFILFLFLEGIINEYATVLFHYEEIAEQFDSLLHDTRENIYKNIVDVKHQSVKIKRYVIAIREILMRITSRNILVITEECRSSLSNLSDHCQSIINEVDSIRELLNSLLGQIDNELMQKMSETMTVLTAFAAIFLPLTLITGIYGMNFHWIPELEWKYGYFGALGLIFCCAMFLVFLFKKNKWL